MRIWVCSSLVKCANVHRYECVLHVIDMALQLLDFGTYSITRFIQHMDLCFMKTKVTYSYEKSTTRNIEINDGTHMHTRRQMLILSLPVSMRVPSRSNMTCERGLDIARRLQEGRNDEDTNALQRQSMCRRSSRHSRRGRGKLPCRYR